MAAEPFPDNRGTEQTPLGAAWRFRWLVLAFTLLGSGLALLYAVATDSSQFQATASLVVTDPRATTLFSAADAARLNADRYVDDQVAILRSDSVAQRASELVGATQPDQVLHATVIAFNVRIFTTGSNEILVQYSAEDEATAVVTANAVIEAYELVRGAEAARGSASAVAQLEQSIADIDAELADIEQQILAVPNNPARDALDAQYQAGLVRITELQPLLTAATGTELIELQRELADLDNQLGRLALIISIEDDSPRLSQLFGEQAEAVSRSSTLAQQRDRLLVDTELLSGGISLSSPAQFAREIKTDVSTITILGALLGLLAGAGLAYLLASQRRKFSERAQPGWVLETSLLAEIPNFLDERITTEKPVADHPYSASAEAFRFAATSLDLQTDVDQEPGSDVGCDNTFLITSASLLAGKSVTTANIALAAAQKGRRVLAIDADFGHQMLTQILRESSDAGIGITEVVETGINLDDAVFSLGPPGTLDLLSRGSRPTTAPDFFSLPATRHLLERVGQMYDLVLIDGPPLLLVAYTTMLARYVDRIIVVVQHGARVVQLEDAAQRLELIGTPLAGYVYNGAPLRHEMRASEGSLQDVLGGPLPGSTPTEAAD